MSCERWGNQDGSLCSDCDRQRCELLVWYCFGDGRLVPRRPPFDLDMCCAIASFLLQTPNEDEEEEDEEEEG
ncbi:hypothetical protein N9L68_02620 [bacterium]|nr:hypothetical protein [bacterium]